MSFATHPVEERAIQHPWGLRLANALVSCPAYLAKLLWPADLGLFYPFPEAVSWWKAGTSAVFLAGLTGLALWAGRTRGYLAVGWLWFLGMLAPTLKLYGGGIWYSIADRFVYLPAVGLYLIVSKSPRLSRARVKSGSSSRALAKHFRASEVSPRAKSIRPRLFQPTGLPGSDSTTARVRASPSRVWPWR
ncbi:MAG: hypothetical protein L7F78_23475, partial [Syntrophales bacterium LBB04]|nr:hypothetical protein [Syntrophales bacterium LBB04]